MLSFLNLLINLKITNADEQMVIDHFYPNHVIKKEVLCFNKEHFNLLRQSMLSCDQIEIDLEMEKRLNNRLMETAISHSPIWNKWWIKLPLSLIVGGVTGWSVGKSTDSGMVGGLMGSIAASGTMALFEINI